MPRRSKHDCMQKLLDEGMFVRVRKGTGMSYFDDLGIEIKNMSNKDLFILVLEEES